MRRPASDAGEQGVHLAVQFVDPLLEGGEAAFDDSVVHEPGGAAAEDGDDGFEVHLFLWIWALRDSAIWTRAPTNAVTSGLADSSSWSWEWSWRML